ncbi:MULTISPECIES: NADH-quinone oxidoreductase subunit D [Acidiplasma]|jgi:NADH-quinone oxidoreductase subunit D|uniref:NADH dehydrogenase n=2 Tax=Acidiplasma TaxID=507753 RepID=A0A0Q0VTW6_9ARCH|nr:MULTISPECIES: NADH-quinone oxidoreductase subunit D [Acidiplasma]KJE49706.1 NADH dehydrogenase [Acidiplasma sp. MBA-1]KPV45955.1 NADH dehydrogenase [Acidiplasma aeolicum]KQB34156.1 NADH dehydrogenase [Acidiplasma aeolicum]KQB35032.1 NADH dehydrogenase [Acidiplasma cupricumulans]WMT55647.1 MAG: NADH-quinone oxidoreductase subunit D [Acidiplasma sp.]
MSRYTVLNLGPVHPSIHGILRFRVKLNEEIIEDVDITIGFLHRNAEKICELNIYANNIIYFDRMDYLDAMNMELGYVTAVEKLTGIEAPERAQWIRMIMAELNRLAARLVGLGAFGLDMGMLTPFFHCFAEREKIQKIFVEASGGRQEVNYISIGGVYQDFNEKIINDIREFSKNFKKRLEDIYNMFIHSEIFWQRNDGIGILEPDVALDYGVTGPLLRGSGIAYDVRKDAPYLFYDKVNFDVPISHRKDNIGRFVLKIEEMRQSIRIIDQCLDKIPDGPYFNNKAKKSLMLRVKGDGEVFSRVESDNGEFGVYVRGDNTVKPYRVHVRSPAFKNISVVPVMARGLMIADLIVIIGSIDTVIGEIDR